MQLLGSVITTHSFFEGWGGPEVSSISREGQTIGAAPGEENAPTKDIVIDRKNLLALSGMAKGSTGPNKTKTTNYDDDDDDNVDGVGGDGNGYEQALQSFLLFCRRGAHFPTLPLRTADDDVGRSCWQSVVYIALLSCNEDDEDDGNAGSYPFFLGMAGWLAGY